MQPNFSIEIGFFKMSEKSHQEWWLFFVNYKNMTFFNKLTIKKLIKNA